MIGRLFKALFIVVMEMFLAVILVLAFALVFTGILIVSFPKGTGLINAYVDSDAPAGSRTHPRIHSLIGEGDLLDLPVIAILSHVRREVRDRPARAVAWKRAHQGMGIEDRHTIQTLSRSDATIFFDENSELRLGENSLVVIKGSDRTRRSQRRHASLLLLGGRVKGRLAKSARAFEALKIETGAGSLEILSKGEEQAEFTVSANSDLSSTFSVHSGVAEVTSAGQTARVEPDHSVTVFPSEPPGAPERTPGAPELEVPPDGHVETCGSIVPRIRFAWSVPADADAYQFVVARDPGFEDVVHSQVTSAPEFTHGNLEEGLYYWRVSALNGSAEGRFGAARSFEISRDVDRPGLALSLPAEIDTDRLVISGKTDPGVRIYIGTRQVPVGQNGEFELALSLDRGLNMIVVEAVDAAGNSTYHSQYVNARFQATE